MNYRCDNSACGAVFDELDADIKSGPDERDARYLQYWPTCPECGCERLTELYNHEDE